MTSPSPLCRLLFSAGAIRRLSTALLVLVPLLTTAHAQSDPAARLAEVAELNSLKSTTMKPWHLKVSYSLHGEVGLPARTGEIEEWWLDKNHHRLVVTSGGVSSTLVVDGEQAYKTSNDKHILPLEADVLRLITDPVSRYREGKVVLKKQDIGNLKADCLQVQHPGEDLSSMPLSLSTSFCVSDQNLLYVSTQAGFIFSNYNTGSFQHHSVPGKLVIAYHGAPILDAEIKALSVIPASEVNLSSAGLQASPKPPVPGGTILAGGSKVKGDTPAYPAVARARNSHGDVLLECMIAADGSVHDLTPVASPDAVLTTAAMEAVKDWKYKPLVVAGVPTAFSTYITVHFGGR